MDNEQYTRHVSAALDSCSLISSLADAEDPLNEDDLGSIRRNVEHLELMLNNDWFKPGLTKEELRTVESAVHTGKEILGEIS